MYKRDDKGNAVMTAHTQRQGPTSMGGLRPGTSMSFAADRCDDASCSSSVSDTGSEQDSWSWPTAAKKSRMDFDERGCSGPSNTQRHMARNLDSSSPKMPVDEERRKVRRERNKLAAARCRQRRVDLTNSLMAETEALENEKVRLEKEIESLHRQTHELQFVLDSHSKRCQISLDIGKSTAADSLQVPVDLTSIKTEKPDTFKMHRSFPRSMEPKFEMTRPNSLPLSSSLASSRGGESHFGGSGLTPGSLTLDFMADGHTGLTPITGVPSAAEVASSIDCPPSNQTLLNL